MKIKQVVVVEGVSDTAKLKKIFGSNNIETIETNGLSLDDNTLKLIKDINKHKGIIIFTDPDGPGLIIREKINNFLNGKCLNAFIKKEKIKNSKKIGIAEAEDEDIKEAFKNLIIFDKQNESITWQEFLSNNFFEPNNRKKIAAKFNWNEKINSKKLFKWLNLTNLNVEEISKILKE